MSINLSTELFTSYTLYTSPMPWLSRRAFFFRHIRASIKILQNYSQQTFRKKSVKVHRGNRNAEFEIDVTILSNQMGIHKLCSVFEGMYRKFD